MIPQYTQVVADSGIFIAAVLKEPYTKQADDLIRSWDKQGVQVFAPTLFLYEITAVIRKNVYRQILTSDEASKARSHLHSLIGGITFVIDNQLLQRGYELAEQYNRPTAYDSQYLALAEQLGCDFWTTDERLFNTLRQDLKWVHWLGNFFKRSSV